MSELELPELCIRFVLSNPAVGSILTGVDYANQFWQTKPHTKEREYEQDLCNRSDRMAE